MTLSPALVDFFFKSLKNFSGNYIDDFGGEGIYLGLHRNAAGNWMWWDYDGTELPVIFNGIFL